MKLILAFLLLSFVQMPQAFAAPDKAGQTVFDQVLKSRTLRCGYFVYAPYIIKDPNTGKLSGSFYDLTEKLGKVLNLKVDWTLETTFSTYIEDMSSGRYDVFCGGLWPMSDTAPYMAYTDSVFYTGYYIYVRKDDHRFDKDLKIINDPTYKFATIDGETSSIIKADEFEKAGISGLPNTADVAQLLLQLTSKKADVTAVEPAVANLFLKSNPDSIRQLNPQKPIRVFATVWGVPAGEQKLANWLNNGVRQMLLSDMVDPIAEKYHQGSYLPAVKPYKN